MVLALRRMGGRRTTGRCYRRVVFCPQSHPSRCKNRCISYGQGNSRSLLLGWGISSPPRVACYPLPLTVTRRGRSSRRWRRWLDPCGLSIWEVMPILHIASMDHIFFFFFSFFLPCFSSLSSGLSTRICCSRP